jgi:hypothetical protein
MSEVWLIDRLHSTQETGGDYRWRVSKLALPFLLLAFISFRRSRIRFHLLR